jgi:hypothetical protein
MSIWIESSTIGGCVFGQGLFRNAYTEGTLCVLPGTWLRSETAPMKDDRSQVP